MAAAAKLGKKPRWRQRGSESDAVKPRLPAAGSPGRGPTKRSRQTAQPGGASGRAGGVEDAGGVPAGRGEAADGSRWVAGVLWSPAFRPAWAKSTVVSPPAWTS